VNTRAVEVPLVWPGLLAATYLAWTQALMWMPYGLRGLRVAIAVICLTAVDAIVFIAIDNEARELTMIALLAPQLPLAYLLAWIAVGRARRGDVPNWSIRAHRATATAAALSNAVFRSPWRAQWWFEWRQHGWTLPAMVAMVVPAELLLWFIPGTNSPTVFITLVAVLITPPFLAAFAAARLAVPIPFSATRPLTTGSLIAAKLAMSIVSTLAAWAIVGVAILAAAEASGKSAALLDRARAIIDVTGALRFVAVASLILAAVIASTWKQLVQSLCIGLSGRRWLIRSSVLLALLVFMAIGPLIDWIGSRPQVQAVLWHGVPWILAAFVIAKTIAASAVASTLIVRGVLSDRTMIVGALSWLGCVTVVYGVLAWLVASPLVPRHELGAFAVLLVPLTRIAAAPLALTWSRHQ
jgi:hypothetical protein